MLFLHILQIFDVIVQSDRVGYIMREEKKQNSSEKDKIVNYEEVNIMPTIEMIECERVTYVREMEEYLQKLKKMDKSDAQKKSFENLVQSKIIHENGEFTERYEYTKKVLKKKR